MPLQLLRLQASLWEETRLPMIAFEPRCREAELLLLLRLLPVYPWAPPPTIVFEPRCSKALEIPRLSLPPPVCRWVRQPTIVFEQRCREALLPPGALPHSQLLQAYQWDQPPMIVSRPR